MRVEPLRDGHRDGIVELVQAVAGTGGAVGWLEVPPPQEVDAWLARLAATGTELLVVAEEGRVLGCGGLRRQEPVVLRTMAEVTKVMTHPGARGRGVGGAVVAALVARARHRGVELLTLECRGNNHGAQRLYAAHGFVVTGRRPDVIAVGAQRFDQVLMHRDLRDGPHGLERHGSLREGPGAT